MPIQITSKDNPRVKQLIKWQKPRDRKKDGVILVEGIREIKLALKGGFKAVEFFLCKEIIKEESMSFLDGLHVPIYEVSESIYKTFAYRESTEGILGVFKEKKQILTIQNTSKNMRVLVLEAIEKPGNLGAIVRTANALGIDLVITTENAVDVFNANVIRSSLGAVFTSQVMHLSNINAFQWLQENGFTSYATSIDFSKSAYETRFETRSAIILGTEARGLSSFWLEKADHRIKIPMNGDVSSLNVSVAAAIFCYEAQRPI